MAFDVTQYRAAHRPFALTVGEGRSRRIFTARHVSAPQVFRFQEMHAAAVAAGNRRRQEAAIRWVLRVAFPWRFSYLYRGDPVRLLLAFEPGARREALADFFGVLRGPEAATAQSNGRATNGTTSSTPISTARR